MINLVIAAKRVCSFQWKQAWASPGLEGLLACFNVAFREDLQRQPAVISPARVVVLIVTVGDRDPDKISDRDYAEISGVLALI